MLISSHHYVVCFNIKNPSIVILDNKKPKNLTSENYGEHIIVLVKISTLPDIYFFCFFVFIYFLIFCSLHKFQFQQQYFTKFMERKGHAKAVELRFSVPECLSLFWQTKYNDVDCGAFTIFHMESYMGDSGGTWLTTLENEIVSIFICQTYCIIHFLSLFNVLTKEFYVTV